MLVLLGQKLFLWIQYAEQTQTEKNQNSSFCAVKETSCSICLKILLLKVYESSLQEGRVKSGWREHDVSSFNLFDKRHWMQPTFCGVLDVMSPPPIQYGAHSLWTEYAPKPHWFQWDSWAKLPLESTHDHSSQVKLASQLLCYGTVQTTRQKPFLMSQWIFWRESRFIKQCNIDFFPMNVAG